MSLTADPKTLTTDQKIEVSRIALEYLGKLQTAGDPSHLKNIAQTAGEGDFNSLFRFIFEEVEAFALSDE